MQTPLLSNKQPQAEGEQLIFVLVGADVDPAAPNAPVLLFLPTAALELGLGGEGQGRGEAQDRGTWFPEEVVVLAPMASEV